MTVGDDAKVKRPRMSPEKRAALGAEAWLLNDTENMSSRTIAARFTKRGDPVSHTTVIVLIEEARATAEYLDLMGPSVIRAGQLGRFETYLEEVRAQIKAGILDAAKGWQLIVSVEKLLTQVGGSVHDRALPPSAGPPPSMSAIRAFADELDRHERRKAEIQGADGLDEFDR